MISLEALNPYHLPTTPDIDEHLTTLCDRVNTLQLAYVTPLYIDSGLRSVAQQEALIKAGRTTAHHSLHLIGAAVDLRDTDMKLYTFLRKHQDLLEGIQLWCEERRGGWQHLQIFPPQSGKRWFIP